MRAMVQTSYGSPDVLELQEVAKPTPKDDEVCIKVHATTVTIVDSVFRQGNPLVSRLFIGLMKPKNAIQGGDFAGEIEAVGKDVEHLQVGDQVFGATREGFGAHAEYLCLPAEGVVRKPTGLSYQEAAAIPYGALTALPFLRDEAKLQAGQSILINGASGGVGLMAVQLARYFGAEVTGVCHGDNAAFVRSLGADHVIDYSQEDFTQQGKRYDVIFDAAGKSSFSACKASLSDDGIYLSAVLSAGILWQMLWTSRWGRKKARIAFTGLRSMEEKAQDLAFLSQLVHDGHLKPVIDKEYPLAQLPEAHQYIEKGRKQGNVVILPFAC